MQIDPDDYAFILSTGTRIDANNYIIGLSPKLDVTGGYDGGVYDEQNNDLTPKERIELADYMIAEWTRFKQKAANEI